LKKNKNFALFFFFLARMSTPDEVAVLAALIEKHTFATELQQALLRDVRAGRFVYGPQCPAPRPALMAVLATIKAPEPVLQYVRSIDFGTETRRPSQDIVEAAMAALSARGARSASPLLPEEMSLPEVDSEAYEDALNSAAELLVPDGEFIDAIKEQRVKENERALLSATPESVSIHPTVQ